MNIPTILLPDGTRAPALGLGTWHMGESASRAAAEEAVLREGIERGLSLIDTAEMYADGGAEKLVGAVIKGQRERVFLVSKIMPQNASFAGVARHYEASMKRLGTDYLDLYLLHWPGSYPLEQTIAAFEQLRAAGKIRHWGVSNFDTAQKSSRPRGMAPSSATSRARMTASRDICGTACAANAHVSPTRWALQPGCGCGLTAVTSTHTRLG